MSSSNSTQDDRGRVEEGGEGGIAWNQVYGSFLDPLNYCNGILFFIANVTFSSLPVYLPTILSEAGFSSIRAQGLSAPPYLAAFLCSVPIMFISDRLARRGLFISFFSALGGVGYVILATTKGAWVRYGAIFLVAMGCFTLVPLLYTWVSNNQVRESQRGAGIAIFGAIGQCGPLLGVHLYPSNEAPYYVKGMSIAAGLLFVASIMSLALSLYFQHVNSQRDASFGPSKLSFMGRRKADKGDNAIGVEMLDEETLREAASGPEWPHFRYVT